MGVPVNGLTRRGSVVGLWETMRRSCKDEVGQLVNMGESKFEAPALTKEEEAREYGESPDRAVVVNWGDVMKFGEKGEGGRQLEETDESLMRRFGYALLFNALQWGCDDGVVRSVVGIFGLKVSEELLKRGRCKVVMKTRVGEYVGGEFLGKMKGKGWGESISEKVVDSLVRNGGKGE